MEQLSTVRPPGHGTDQGSALLTRPTCSILLASVGALASFDLLFAVVPLAAAARHGGIAAGLTTGALLLGTVLLEPQLPRLTDRFGDRAVLAVGLLLLGAPAVLMPMVTHLSLLVAVCALRGAGLGIMVVAGTTMMARSVPAERRGEALGLYGVAVGIPAVICLPLGVWLVGHVGFSTVTVMAGAASLLALFAVAALPVGGRGSRNEPPPRVLGSLRRDGLVRPLAVMVGVTVGVGAALTFVPLALPADTAHLAAAVLLAQSATTPLARWVAGRFGDRFGSEALLTPAVLAAAGGTASLVWVEELAVVLVGMAVLGVGFGVAQSATLAVMLARVTPAQFGRVSALWNLAYDGGLGIGAVSFGLLLGPLGYGVAFASSSLLMLAALLPRRS